MPIHPIEKLSKYRKADTVVLLGSGSSINRLTPEAWEKIGLCDTLALNNWVYHPSFVPDFYMIEVKSYDFCIMQERLQQKWEHYQHCQYIFLKDKLVRFPDKPRCPIINILPGPADVFEYAVQHRDQKRTSQKVNALYQPHPVLFTKSYDSSVTVCLELVWRMGYKTVILCGFDIFNSLYFWSGGEEKYGRVHHLTNKAHEGKDPTLPHATAIVKDFIVDFSKRWMWEQGRELYVGHTDTALYPEIPLIDWRTHDV